MFAIDAALIALASVAILGGLELVGRAIGHLHPEPLRWHDLFTQRREDQMRALSRDGGVDIVVIGASDVLFSVHANVVARSTGRSCYNASIYRAVPTVTEAWLRDRVLDLLRPSVVVLGTLPAVFNDDSPLTTRLREYQNAPVFRAGRLRRAHWLLGRHSFALRYAGLLRHPRRLARVLGRVIRQGDCWHWAVPLVIPDELDAGGRCLTMLNRNYGHGPRMLDLIRRQVGPGFRDGGEQRAAFARMIQMLRSRGITTVVSLSPTCADLVDDVFVDGRHGWEAHQDQIKRIAEDAGARVIDVAAGIDQRAFFADMLHTNGTGQAEFSYRLGDALAELLDRPAAVPVAAGHA